MIKSFAYVRPTSVDDALEMLGADGARVHAGGTDLMGCLRDGVFEAERVVSLRDVPGMRGVRASTQGVTIGALTPLAEIARHSVIGEQYTALARAASVVGTPQLRSQGTLGGNICQRPRCPYFRAGFDCRRKGGRICYAVGGDNHGHAIFGGVRCHMVHPSDTAAALTALDATVVAVGRAGERRIPIGDFFVAPSVDPTRETVLEHGEMVKEIVLPPAADDQRSSYHKEGHRRTWDFALAGAATALRMTGGNVAEARVVFSGVAPVPWRSMAAEEALQGNTLTPEVIGRACDAAVEGAAPMRHNAYKVGLLKGVLEKEMLRYV
ncbi:MAG: FAD binding domain-containing protein [Gemmatimonadetes bacterium]|nr:FAD binding domain-containing protein [Gemmatimonadota bacterium]